jgi:Fe-S cluster biogenesis protein NfuA/nitrite reductase/ring-hydroxylating ferredoxin subunit
VSTDAPHEVGQRIEALLDDLAGTADPKVAGAAEQLVRLLAQMYGEGLERIVETLDKAGPDGARLLDGLAADDLVSALLALHGLHPVPIEVRIAKALDEVRPYLGSHAGGIEFLGIDDDGVARLRLEGSCDGCPSSALTVQSALEGAIEKAAPELAAIEVEGVVEAPVREPAAAGGLPLLQIERAPHHTAGQGWVDLSAPGTFHPGGLAAVRADGVPLVLCGLGTDVVAYRDRCPACGARLGEASLDGEVLTCAGCGSAYDVRHAGAGLGTTSRLEPVPLLPGPHGGHRVALAATQVGAAL